MDREILTESRLNDRQPLPGDRRIVDVLNSVPGRRVKPKRGCSTRGRESTRGATKRGAAHRVRRRPIPLGRVSAALDETWDSLLECTPDLVVLVDGDGLISRINHVPAKSPTGREGVIGRRICDFLAPEYRAKAQESIKRVLQTGETIRQVVCFSGNGSGAWCSEACIGPVTRDGQVVAVGIFFTDITERERLQARLRERERLLRSIVRAVPKMMDIVEGLIRHGTGAGESARRARELELCREQMIQIGRLASIGKASSSLTQRLPQFLTAIGMSLGNALAELGAVSGRDGAARELEAALQAVSALAMGVDQVRNFAETSSRNPLVHAVDLGESLARVVRLLETRVRGANTVICTDNCEAWPAVRMAEGDAEQLCFALIDNLTRCLDSQRSHRITVGGVMKEHEIELRFSGDDGLGEKEDSDVLLDRPFPAEPAAQGMDLGLYVAWDIVARAGGTIRCERTDGVGSTFFVSLPIADRARSKRGQNGARRKTTCFRRR